MQIASLLNYTFMKVKLNTFRVLNMNMALTLRHCDAKNISKERESKVTRSKNVLLIIIIIGG